MMAISTSRIESSDISTQSKSKTRDDDTGEQDSFAGLLNLTSAKSEATSYTKSDSSTSDITSQLKLNSDYDTQAKTDYDYEKSDASASDTSYESDKYDKYDTTSDSGKTYKTSEKAKTSDNKTEVSSDKADAISEDIKAVLKDKLGVTDEELNDILETFGVDATALIEPDMLKNVVLAAEDATEVDLLVDENLTSLLGEVTEAVSGILEEYGIDFNDADQIAELLSSYNNVAEVTENADDSDNTVYVNQNADDSSASDGADADVSADGQVEIEVTTETVQSGSADGSQSTQDNGASGNQSQIALNLNQAIDDAIGTEAAEGTVAYSDALEQAEIVRQVVDSIKVNITRETSAITVQLNPENLGRVQVSVANRNGVMQAQIIAETESARHAIENNIALLKETFNNHELKVDAVEVMVASQDYFSKSRGEDADGDNKERQTRSALKLNLNGDADDDMLSDEEKDEMSVMQAIGSSVSYSA